MRLHQADDQDASHAVDFPFEDRAELTQWSDVAEASPADADSPVQTEERRFAELKEMAGTMGRLFAERSKRPPKFDLLSMLAHAQATRDMPMMEFIGNLSLLIAGGNDTTRNSMTSGLLALHRFPDDYRKLATDPRLVESAVPEIIRWATPVIHMRRTAVRDIELGGKRIRAGEKVVRWYISGNRDAEAIDQPDRFIVDRPRPRQHLSFGFGIHRCVGNRLAELQLKILWEEMLARFVKHANRTQTARRFYRANGYVDAGRPNAGFGTRSGYRLSKPLTP